MPRKLFEFLSTFATWGCFKLENGRIPIAMCSTAEWFNLNFAEYIMGHINSKCFHEWAKEFWARWVRTLFEVFFSLSMLARGFFFIGSAEFVIGSLGFPIWKKVHGKQLTTVNPCQLIPQVPM